MRATFGAGLWVAIAAGAVGALAPAISVAQAPVRIPCPQDDRACMHRYLQSLPARTAAYWKPMLARPVAERLGPAPMDLVTYLTVDNSVQGFPERPRPSVLTPPFLEDVRGAISDLPPAVRRVFDANFAGVWFVDELGGTGYTDIFTDSEDRPVGGFVVLDAAVLGKFTANAWATWKENTPFKAGDGWTLEARIEEAANDDRRGAIRYILLHELGHVLSIGRDIHPRWDREPKQIPAGERFPFYELSWKVDLGANRYVSAYDAAFPKRAAVAYYRVPQLAATDMSAVYDDLGKTNFPTLYAATSPGDDFAESFVSYVHTVLMKRPWRITLRKDGQVAKTYGTCWEEARCAAKRRILEDLLK